MSNAWNEGLQKGIAAYSKGFKRGMKHWEKVEWRAIQLRCQHTLDDSGCFCVKCGWIVPSGKTKGKSR